MTAQCTRLCQYTSCPAEAASRSMTPGHPSHQGKRDAISSRAGHTGDVRRASVCSLVLHPHHLIPSAGSRRLTTSYQHTGLPLQRFTFTPTYNLTLPYSYSNRLSRSSVRPPGLPSLGTPNMTSIPSSSPILTSRAHPHTRNVSRSSSVQHHYPNDAPESSSNDRNGWRGDLEPSRLGVKGKRTGVVPRVLQIMLARVSRTDRIPTFSPELS